MAMMAEHWIRERLVQLGPFVVDTATGEVRKHGELIRITEQPTRILLVLMEKPGEIVSRDDIRAKLWPNNTNVEFDHSIHAAINKLRHALGDSPEQPRFIETVPRRGYRLIASITPVIASESPEQFTSTTKISRPPAWQNRTGILIGGALLAMFILLAAVMLQFKPKSGSQAGSASQPSLTASVPRRIAILGFRNLSDRKESDWLSTAFSEMLASELGTSADLQPVSGTDVAQMERELSISDADSYTEQTLHKIQQNLGTELLLVGSFLPIGRGNPQDRIRFDVRLLNAGTGQTVATISETGTVSDLFDLVSDAGLRLRVQLGATPLSSSEQAEIRRSMPVSGAQLLYFSGLEKIRNFDYKGARETLTKAVASDAKSSLAHEALSIAYSASGYESLAAKEAALAFELAHGLTYEQGLQVEGRYYETKHAWSRAAEAYQRLCSLSPHTIDFSLRLAHVQVLDGKPNNAMATLQHLRAYPRAAKDQAQIDLAEASVYQESGDSKKELAAAKEAARLGEQAHAPLVVARALRMQGVASEYLGDNTHALENEHQAESIFKALQDPGGLMDTLIDEGDVLSDLGDMTAAESVWQRSAEIARNTQSKINEAVATNNLGNALLGRGESEQALRMYRRSYELFVETDYKTGRAISLLTIGDALQSEGRLQEARKYHEQSLQLSTRIANQEVRTEALEALAGDLADLGYSDQAKRIAQQAINAAQVTGDKPTENTALLHLGQILAAQGSLAEAQSTLQKAAENATALGNKSLQAASHRWLAETLALQGDTAKARANYQQALALAQSSKSSIEERETRYDLAQLGLDDNQPADARETLQQLQTQLKSIPNISAELECLILQAKLELLNKQNSGALSTALRAQSVAEHQDRLDLKMSAAEVLAKAAAGLRRWTQADEVVASALRRASQSACMSCELKAKFLQCEVKATEGTSDSSRCFANLENTARSRGFGRIANLAASRLRTLQS